MNFAILIVILIGVVSLILTLLVAGKSDKNYTESTKRNTMNLTVIYAVVIILSLVAVGVYVTWFV
ncbi:hypothetical protein SAMN05877753_106155 [Bacillus oleivorans]|uniref:Uncharacterized protein n=1 Tax=Bacillus oleivorans TaxID=1448271 RepID=A0A285CYL1_9BACI|nr:hypothetical protein [Bacillus oleivorans]SNX72642.1 hypothetical protein SAMN05877753_106155 [Bacillus oleivorans]